MYSSITDYFADVGCLWTGNGQHQHPVIFDTMSVGAMFSWRKPMLIVSVEKIKFCNN